MAGLRPHLEHGPETYLVNENLVGGVFVEPVDATTTVKKVKKATAGSTRVLGLALGDAAAVAGGVAETTDPWGRPTAGGLTPPNEVAVAYRGSWWLKNTSGATIHFGDRIKCAAGGAFEKATLPADAALVIGVCIHQEGPVLNNTEGKFRLTLGR